MPDGRLHRRHPCSGVTTLERGQGRHPRRCPFLLFLEHLDSDGRRPGGADRLHGIARPRGGLKESNELGGRQPCSRTGPSRGAQHVSRRPPPPVYSQPSPVPIGNPVRGHNLGRVATARARPIPALLRPAPSSFAPVHPPSSRAMDAPGPQRHVACPDMDCFGFASSPARRAPMPELWDLSTPVAAARGPELVEAA